MEIAEVIDRASLEAYLNGLSGEEGLLMARRVAFRAAARVAPLALRVFADSSKSSKRDLTALPIFGSLAIGGLAAVWPTPSIGAHAASAAARAAADAAADAAANAAAYAAAYAAAHAAAHAAADAAAHAAADAAANAAANAAAYAAANAADAADAADFWDLVRQDLQLHPDDSLPHLWPAGEMPDKIAVAWAEARELLLNDPSGTDWQFWITWYERVLTGKNIHADLMVPILNTLTKKDWVSDPARVNPLFDEVLAVYVAEDAAKSSSLAHSTPVEFTFEQMLCVMRLIGKDQSTDHLRDPAVVQSFLDDAEDVREGFEDFVDDAREIQGGNYVGVLRKRADKILAEFDRAKNDTHLRAERIVMLANDLEIFAKDEKAATDLGDTLKQILDTRLDSLKRLCRTHFGPAYETLAPLSGLKFDQISQAEVLRMFDDAIVWIEGLADDQFIPLDGEGIAVFQDMRRELHDYRAAIGEANTDEFRQILESRFAASTGAMGLSFGRFVERSANAAGKGNAAAGHIVKGHKNATGLADIIQPILEFLNGGGPTP